MKRFTAMLVGCALFGALVAVSAAAEPEDAKGIEFFEKRIRPVLVEHCYKCHSSGSDEVKGGLLLDTRAGIRAGGDSGHAVVPGNLDESVLIESIRYESYEMPPDRQLPDRVIANFVKWVEMGAPDPRDGASAAVRKTIDFDEARQFWSFQPPRRSPMPEVADRSWPRGAIDRFILARLEDEGLRPVEDADRRTLIRRATFDLTGLPPTPDEVEAFVVDESPQAFEKVIDRLLASPRFGERWGRHWLDVARYAESTGMDRNYTTPTAWRFRDYVIDAFNADKPFDRFIMEQVAGDLLPADGETQYNEQLIATGFLALGPKGLNERDADKFQMDVVDDQIDATSRGFLGLTVGCARCHDHKFDPIPTANYYGMAGIFRSTTTYAGNDSPDNRNARNATGVRPLGRDGEKLQAALDQHREEVKDLESQLKKAEKELASLRKDFDKRAAGVPAASDVPPVKKLKQPFLLEAAGVAPKPTTVKAKQALIEAKRAKQQVIAIAKKKAAAKSDDESDAKEPDAKESPVTPDEIAAAEADVAALEAQLAELIEAAPPEPAGAMGVSEAEEIADCRIYVRGEKTPDADVPPRGFVTVAMTEPAPEIGTDTSGRLELARWLASTDNPLTARVMVNRIWHHLFGAGLVTSVDNFGSLGDRPSHPELLDYLAIEFMEEGWSVKRAIRSIMLSRAYQLSSEHDDHNYSVDGDNRLVWRMSRRRLDAESIRDAVLSFSGEIEYTTPEHGSIVAEAGHGEVGRGLKPEVFESYGNYRSVYMPILRGAVPDVLRVYDVADPNLVVGARDVTTVATQALFMMNSPFVMDQCEAAGRRILADEDRDDAGRIELAYRLALGRPPDATELDRSLEYIKEYDSMLDDDMPDAERQSDLWTSFCQVLVSSAEFRYLY